MSKHTIRVRFKLAFVLYLLKLIYCHSVVIHLLGLISSHIWEWNGQAHSGSGI